MASSGLRELLVLILSSKSLMPVALQPANAVPEILMQAAPQHFSVPILAASSYALPSPDWPLAILDNLS